VFAIGALLAGLFVGTAEALVDANADEGMVATAAAGDTIEALGRRDPADARGGPDLMAGGPEDDGGMDGLAAPGDSAAPGAAIPSTSFKEGDPNYSNISGSSQAAPHVAGALACARATGKNRIETRRDLFESARDRGPPGRDEYLGRGALDMPGTVR